MNKKKYISFIVITIVIIAGGFAIKNKLDNKSRFLVQEDLGIATELIDVSKRDLVEDINYIGTISSKKTSTVSPTIGGQIKNIYLEEGSQVKAGDLIASIDDSQLRSSLNTASKKLETLNTNYNFLVNQVADFYNSNALVKKVATLKHSYDYIEEESEKYRQLYEEGAVAKSVYDKAKQEADMVGYQLAELEASVEDSYNKISHERNMTEKQLGEVRASINEINIKIAEASIKAPIAGVVKKIYYNEGNLAGMGMPFADIDDNEELIVKINISESDIGKINLSNKVILKAQGYPDEIISQVSNLIPNINPNTRVGIIEVGPIKGGEENNLVSGSSIQANIVVNDTKDIITIPKKAIKNLGGEDMVYLYQDGIVKEVKISTGLTLGENTQVIEGLSVGDQIAVKNLSKLYDHAKVYVYKGVDK